MDEHTKEFPTVEEQFQAALKDDPPRRRRFDRAALAAAGIARTGPDPLADVKPLSDQIQENAMRFSIGVQNLQKERDDYKDKLTSANARIEQFEASVTRLESEIVTLRLERDKEQQGRIRLSAILEQLGGLIADGLDQGD